MNHVAIDLGSKESQVCVRRGDGTILDERKCPTRKLGEWMKQLEPSRVILETTSEAFRVADAARAAGHEVRVVPATLARQLGVGEHGVKTDKRDARKLSEVSCRIELPSVHIPTENARELRSLLRSRELLVATRTKTINHVRGWLRTQLGRLRTGWTGSFTDGCERAQPSSSRLSPITSSRSLQRSRRSMPRSKLPRGRSNDLRATVQSAGD